MGNQVFPVLLTLQDIQDFRDQGGVLLVTCVPMALVEEKVHRCVKNYKDTAHRLKEKGGLPMDGLLSILEDREFASIPILTANFGILNILSTKLTGLI